MLKHLDIMTRRRLRQAASAIDRSVMQLPVMSDDTFNRICAFGVFFAVVVGGLVVSQPATDFYGESAAPFRRKFGATKHD